jgi:hypothetical protein
LQDSLDRERRILDALTDEEKQNSELKKQIAVLKEELGYNKILTTLRWSSKPLRK